MTALTQPPVSVAFDADSVFCQLFSGGVLHFWSGTNLDHDVLAVGYGTEGSTFLWVQFRTAYRNRQGSCGLHQLH